MTTPSTTIIEACADPALFGRWFRRPETWSSWFAFLRVLFGLPLSAADLALFRECTGRTEPWSSGYREAWLVVGRRGGKSLVLATIAVFLATLRDWSPYLTGGERGTIMVIAADRRQARVIYRYIGAMLRVALLAPLIERDAEDIVELSNGISIEILTASFRSVRGYSIVAALCDELAFWRIDEGSTNPDVETIGALRPAMSTIPGAMLLCASSPYARRGALWTAFKRNFGRATTTLVWRAATRTMNPTVPQAVIDEAMELDPSRAAAEYGAEFRTDVESFVSREAVDAVTVPGRLELPPVSGVSYFAFVDPSGGSADSMTMAIGHLADRIAVVDCVREIRPPFSPESVVSDFAVLLRTYRIGKVFGDRYAGEWPRERFRTHGVEYLVSVKAKSEIYRDLLPVLNAGRVELPDLPRLAGQLCGLERRTARGGKDSIDHAPGGRDDIANAVAGVVERLVYRPKAAIGGPGIIVYSGGENSCDPLLPSGSDAWAKYHAVMRGGGNV
jgi:hypothetical protein